MVVQSQSLDAYDDRRLVAAFQAGDADAFAQIVGAHHSSLTAEARRRLRSTGDAEDAVQETLLRAYLALDRFGGDYHLHAWLSRILANVCADAGARQAAELRLVDRMGAPQEDAPPADEGVEDAEQQRAVKEAVDSLPESYRMAFILREIEEFSYAQVADKMGISEANARARVHRARRFLTRALRNTGGVLAGFPISLHLIGLKRLVPRSASKKVPALTSYSTSSRFVAPGQDIPSTALPVASSTALPVATQSSLPALFQAPLAETSQAVALAASSPLSQTLIAGASVAWHATLPVAAALATVAASAAMVGSGAAASSPTPPDPTASTHIIMAAGTTDLASFVNTPPAASPPAPPTAAPATSASSAPSTSASAATTSTAGTATTSSDPWGWVGSAASGSAGGEPTTSSSSGGQVPTQAAGSSASAGVVAPVACPWTGTFPGAPTGPIALPPPEPAGTVASSYYSSDTFTLGTLGAAGAAFEVGGLGQFAQGANSVTLQTLYGACLPATSNPELVANLSNPSAETLGQLQLRGALVSSQTVSGDTTAYYRGTAVWLDGPNASTATPLVFVAQVTLGEPTNISTLRVAFFGPAPTFTPPVACPAGTTSTSPADGTTPSASDTSATSGTSPTGSPNCTPTTTTTTTTPTPTPTPPSATPPPRASDPASDTSSTDASSDPPSSAAIATSTRWTPHAATAPAAS
jgi:RNA polymerase sigma-70 factor (ECF subfamily)